MPTRTLNRKWCKTCNDYQLFGRRVFNEPIIECLKCETVHVETPLSEIPEEKIEQQRRRYKESVSKRQNESYMKFFGSGYGKDNYLDMFSGWPSNENDLEIYEDDEGQQMIDEETHRIRMEEIRLRGIQKQEDLDLKSTFKDVGRNDTCLCGSGLKYKKCCYSKIEKI